MASTPKTAGFPADHRCPDCLQKRSPCDCEWECWGCFEVFANDSDAERHEVDGETYCSDCALALILEVAS